MYSILLLALYGFDPTADAPRPTHDAAAKESEDKAASKTTKKTTKKTKDTSKSTTKKSPTPKPTSPSKAQPLAKPEPAPAPSAKPTSTKAEKPPPPKPPPSGGAHGDDRPHDGGDDHGAHDGGDDHGAHDGGDDHGAHDGGDDHGAHEGADHDRPPAAHPPHHSSDHRYARPTVHHLPQNPHAHAPPPGYAPYRGWYTHWWVHPYWRWQHATVVVVVFPFVVDPWADAWVPPARHGWSWIPGHFEHGFWVPGHWAPVGPPVAGYVYVPGWWYGDVYVGGYYRVASRDRWRWIEGRYAPDGAYVAGHWQPTSAVPDGYTWEPGFFDGETWIEGYWRPLARTGYRWVPARTTGEGVYCSGYWEPVETRADHVWVPGWFDGNQWVEGYWVSKREYDATDPSAWEPDPGWDADEQGRDDSDPEPPVAIAVPDVD